MLSSYFSHRVYCQADFPRLTRLLGEYLSSKRYFVGDDDGCDYFKLSDLRAYDYQASVIAAPVKWLLKEGHGLLFKSVNLRRQCIEKGLSYKDFPIALRQRFSTHPNYIEIDSFRSQYDVQKSEGKELENWLSGYGFKAYIRSFNGEFIDVIETGYADADERAEEVHKLVQEFLEQKSIPTFDLSGFSDDMLWLVHNLHPDTLRVLVTAEQIRKALPDLPDCSAIVIEYCKAVEIELNHRLLVPLRSHLNGAGSSNSACLSIPNELGRLKQYVYGASAKQIELGALANTIEAALRYDSHPLAAGLMQNIRALPLMGSPKKLIDSVLNLTQNYRNPAAHKAILSSMQMERCRELVLGATTDIGLLFRIVQSS